VLLVASLLALVLLGGGIAVAVAVSGASTGVSPDLPTLPAPLNQHLDDLWKEVGP
jgi:hypothetical protein